ncbi:uncharacterized protein KY384_004305 [Bacidia gigantensis]|uniref:uncharacterized protein n=1 Tax=Bacidia gigantensis TaxID=2732470 RepID=UPI001D042F28|nr:uncharacterized protein KY384_004305 [Bacidia gigantensis]KAG8530948.1 hypothetical protein KY384_004305 [Bacidia gigantensis]
MPHSKTPGGQAASAKFLKQEAQKHGEGATNAAGHTDGKQPGEASVASDSGNVGVGIEKGTNQPGEKGIGGPNIGPVPESLKETRGA